MLYVSRFGLTSGWLVKDHAIEVFSRTDVEIEVVLEGDTDEVGDGVLRFLGQFLGLGLAVDANLGSDRRGPHRGDGCGPMC